MVIFATFETDANLVISVYAPFLKKELFVMPNTKLLIFAGIVCAASLGFSTELQARQSISVNFHADDLGDSATSDPAAHRLEGVEEAGIASARSSAWNNVLVGNGGGGTGATIFPTQSLTDDLGNSAAATIASTRTSGTTSAWFIGYAASSAADEVELANGVSDDNLFNSYLALNGPSGDGSPQDSFVLDVTGLGGALTTGGYDLIIYSDTDRGATNTADRTSVFTVTPAGGSPIMVLTEDDGSVGGTYNGSYVASDNSDTSDSYSNYTVVSGLTAASFTIEITSPGGGGRGGISGFQIVPPAESPAQPDGPNVVLFFVDDMGWSDWEKYSDYYESPNMLRMASEGMEFTGAYASCSVCSPTRGSLMTGFSPAHHRVTKWIPGNPANDLTNNDEPLSSFNIVEDPSDPDRHYMWSEALSEAGYHGGHFGKWHLGRNEFSAEPLNFGYQSRIVAGARYTSYENDTAGLDPNIDENFLTDHMAIEAKNYIDARVAAGEKFFLSFNTNAPHTPIVAHPDHIDHFENKARGTFGHDDARYASMLFGVDKALGTILDALEDNGIRNDTIVIFTSDHGGLTSPSRTSNAPFRGGKGQQWEGAHRVPFIITGPGIPANVTTEYQTITHDLYPTLLELTGVTGNTAHNAEVEGISIVPAIFNTSLVRSEPLYWHFPHASNHSGGVYGIVIDGNNKYIEKYDSGDQLMYDLVTDTPLPLQGSVGEQNNIINANPKLAVEMRQDLHDYLRQYDAALWSGQFELLWPLGDVNRDGSVNFLDISPFVALLTNSQFEHEADLNCDGAVDFLDISPFIALLSQ